MIVISGIIEQTEDFDLRVHHRSQMESAGLDRILELFLDFGFPTLDKLVRQVQEIFAEDERKLRERLDQEILKSLSDPQDVFNAICARTRNTKAQNYFLSMMQHMLLIREEGPPMVHYYQLIDSLITDVVLDKKLAGAEQRLGQSVDRIIAQFNEVDRTQALTDEASEARSIAMQLKLEKEALEDEVAQGQDGLVGRLKRELEQSEEKLTKSRDMTARLQSKVEAQKAGYEERITQLEYQIMELFRMLKEVGHGVDHILDAGSSAMDRKSLVAALEKQMQRNKTISILEGRDSIRGKGGKVGKGGKEKKTGLEAQEDESSSSDDDDEVTPRKVPKKSKKPGKHSQTFDAGPESSTSRSSQFMDADENDVEEQMQLQLAAGAKAVRALALSKFCLPNARL